MIATLHKNVISIGIFLLLVAVAYSSYMAEPIWLLTPVALLVILFLLQYPVALFYVLIFSIPWSVEYVFPAGFGTDLPDEPLMLLASFSALLFFIAQKKPVERKRLHPIIILLSVQLIWLAFTVVFSSHFNLSAKYFLAKLWYLLAFVGAPLFLWKDEKVFRRSVAILFCSMLLVTTVSLIRHASLQFSFAHINNALAPFFRNHVNYSALLVFIIPIQFFIWRQTKTKPLRALLLLSFLITIPALYFSFARGAWLALIIGILAYWLIKKRWLFQSFVFAIIFIAASFFWLKQNDRYLDYAHDFRTTIFHEDFNEHLAATYQLKDVSTAERFYRWIAGVRMIDDSWKTGFGPTTFYENYKSYTVPAFKTWVSKNEEKSTVHNYFLLLIIEQGALGLLFFLILLGAVFWYAQKNYHSSTNTFWKGVVATVAVIVAMQCTVNFLSDLIETDKAGSVFYLCIAALIIADRSSKKSEYQEKVGLIG